MCVLGYPTRRMDSTSQCITPNLMGRDPRRVLTPGVYDVCDHMRHTSRASLARTFPPARHAASLH